MQSSTPIKVALPEEKPQFNQYWYSAASICFLADQALSSKRVCFLSTPSLYFEALRRSTDHSEYWLYDIDPALHSTPNCFAYDYRLPEQMPANHRGYFDMVIVDPPFITEEVWRLYSKAIYLLIKEGGKILLTTIAQNAPLLKDILRVSPKKWRPSIPHLVYQYEAYANYEDQRLNQMNPEIPE